MTSQVTSCRLSEVVREQKVVGRGW